MSHDLPGLFRRQVGIVNLPSRIYNHPSMSVSVRSFAKINLGLRIGAARNGFHELLTVYQTIELHDVLRVGVRRGKGIEIRCADPRVPKDESNTCFRIVDKAMSALRVKGRVVIEIEKRLPVQGGLGGASANAVAALLGLEETLNRVLPATEKLRIAAEVGSDLPLFLVGGTVLGVGRGERVYPLPDFPAAACVVVTPEVGVSTPKAFAEWDRMGAGSRQLPAESRSARLGQRPVTTQAEPNPGEGRSAGQSGAAVPTRAKPAAAVPPQGRGSEAAKLTASDGSDRMSELSCGLSAWLSEPYSGAPFRRGRAENPLLELVRAGIENDFEKVVFPEYPELSDGKRALLRAGARYASLSGSGSALYGLFASREAAVLATAKLRKQGWTALATATLPRRAYWKRMVAG
jgi:4-diphosphocytidyl-2-C-methyl-D-erythritol kinase